VTDAAAVDLTAGGEAGILAIIGWKVLNRHILKPALKGIGYPGVPGPM